MFTRRALTVLGSLLLTGLLLVESSAEAARVRQRLRLTVSSETTPGIAITAPSPASGTVSITAQIGTRLYKFLTISLDGTEIARCQTSSCVASWNTRLGPNGTHSLTAQNIDARKRVRESASVSVIVNNDLTPPYVTLSAPSTATGPITLSASASDAGGVAALTILVDGTPLQATSMVTTSAVTSTTSSTSATWDASTATPGSHTVQAMSTDQSGNVGSSAPATVVVGTDAPPSAPLDQYGGYTGIKGTATGYFHTEKLGNRWWLITPEGNAFFSLEVDVVSCISTYMDSTGLTLAQNMDAKYAIGQGPADGFTNARERCSYYARERLRQWGFNTIGTFTYYPSLIDYGAASPRFPPMGSKPSNLMPQVMTQRNAPYAMRDASVKNLYGPVWGVAGGSTPYFPDVFDPAFTTFVNQNAQTGYWSDSPWVLYVFTDQTDELRGTNNYHTHLGFIAAATAPIMSADSHAWGGAKTYTDSTIYSKFALRDFLRSRYGTLAALNAAWGTSYTSWDSAGGWGVGTGFLDENGTNLGNWSTTGIAGVSATNPQKAGFPAVRQDLDAFAATLMRRYYHTIFQAYRLHKPHHLLITNDMAVPHQYVYEGLRSEDGTQTYADVIFADDANAGTWSDYLNIPFMGKLKGYYTAENDSPLGYQGTIQAVAFDDVAQTMTITASGVNFWWAGNPLYKLVHNVHTQFSSLPPKLTKNGQTSNQHYRSAKADWLAPNQFVVRPYSYYNGTYAELKAAIKVGDTFRRAVFFTPDAPYDRQEDRGAQYATDLAATLAATSPNGTRFIVGTSWWAYADRSWINHIEAYNFGLVTLRDNAYDGVEASFSPGVDQFGFTRIPETPPPHLQGQTGFGDFLSTVTAANLQVYE